MGKTQTKTVSVNLDKIDPITLPELANFKETQLKVVKENPFVQIEDNKSYEEAKKARTTLVTARTTLQKQEKLITSKLNDFKKRVKDVTGELIAITEPHEIKQQEEVKRYEDIKEQERLEKERIEQERINKIKNKIDSFKSTWTAVIDSMAHSEIKSQCDELDKQIEEHKEFNFEEFELDFDVAVGIVKEKFTDKIEVLNAREIVRQQEEKEKKEREERERNERFGNQIQAYVDKWNKTIDTLAYVNIEKVLEEFNKDIFFVPDGFIEELEQKKSRIKTMLDAKINLLQKEKAQEDERLKFEQEKADFERKQKEALYQERRKQLEDIGYYKHFPEDQSGEAKLVDFSDMDEYSFEQYFNGLKNLVEKIENAEVVDEEVVTGDEIEEVDFEETYGEAFKGDPVKSKEYIIDAREVLGNYSGKIIVVDNSEAVIQIDPIAFFNEKLKPILDRYPKQYSLKHTKKDGYSLIFTENG